eukprot:gene17303-23872_t
MVLNQPLKFAEEKLNTLINASSPNLLIQAQALNESGKDDRTHRLIHIISDDEFNECSAQILLRMEYLNHSDRIRVINLVFFYPMSVISNGGEFKTKSLGDKENSSIIDTIELNESIIKKFNLTSDNIIYSPKDNILYSPVSKTFAAIDFLTRNALSNQFYNATWYRDHSIIMDSADGKSGLYRLISKLSSDKKHYQKASVKNFYFAVPEPIFDTMSKMPLLKWNTSIDAKKEIMIKR